MKTLKISLFFILFSAGASFGQASNGTFMINAYSGPVFSNFGNTLNARFLMGLEGNYFFGDHISFTGGLDFDASGSGTAYGVIGNRIYISDKFFLRHRTSISLQNPNAFDMILGLGNDFMISDNWAVEANLDYHVPSKGVGIKLGFSWFI